MERNIDKIKRLEHELGRYQKKVADQAKENAALREKLTQADLGNRETQDLVDAILTAVVLEHGTAAEDPDEPGKALGWRLSVPIFDFLQMRQQYEIHARRDLENDAYILGVARREAAEHEEAEGKP